MTTPTTRAQANEILFLWKVGAEIYPPHVIAMCLYLTGDLDEMPCGA